MSVYLQDIPLAEAKKRLSTQLKKHNLWENFLGEEKLDIDENLIGRVLSRPVFAKISTPHYHASAMDGYAVVSEQTYGAMPTNPITLESPETFLYVDTGDPVPKWSNAVIPIENIEALSQDDHIAENPRNAAKIRIRESVPPWRHIRSVGEDMISSQLVLPSGHVIRPVDLGAAAACGNTSIFVVKKPLTTIIPTGTELISIGEDIEKGRIIEFNSIMLAGQIKEWGGIPSRYKIVPDKFELILENINKAALDSDLILINAGSSAGSEDFSASAVQELGELLVHGIAVRPGHPVILGLIKRPEKSQKQSEFVPIIGVPGYPVSAALTGEIFVKPMIQQWLGVNQVNSETITAKLTRKTTSPAGDDDYLRVALARVNGEIKAAPISKGAGVISSLVKADGITVIPRSVQGYPAGQKIEVNLLRSVDELEKTILAIGSHDITLDLLTEYLSKYNRRFVSVNVGSIGGLHALKRQEAHLAGIHLLNPQTGEYNLDAVKQYDLENTVLMHWVKRKQGIIVQKGNPIGINSLKDIAESNCSFINRQRGSGTRVLLDYHLEKTRIETNQITGYDQEEYTHLSVAVAVQSGKADCGLGIAAAAEILDLDFVPLFDEEYELVIPKSVYDSELFAPFLDLINSKKLIQKINQTAGYNAENLGKIK